MLSIVHFLHFYIPINFKTFDPTCQTNKSIKFQWMLSIVHFLHFYIPIKFQCVKRNQILWPFLHFYSPMLENRIKLLLRVTCISTYNVITKTIIPCQTCSNRDASLPLVLLQCSNYISIFVVPKVTSHLVWSSNLRFCVGGSFKISLTTLF